MSAIFSWETKDLLDRADRAIERLMELRKESARAVAQAKKFVRYVQVNLYRDSTDTFRQQTAADPVGERKYHLSSFTDFRRDRSHLNDVSR
jgi:hypothetical protein